MIIRCYAFFTPFFLLTVCIHCTADMYFDALILLWKELVAIRYQELRDGRRTS